MKQLIILLAGFLFAASAWSAEVESATFKWTGKKVTGQHYGKLPLKSSKISTAKGKITGGEFVIDLTKLTVDDLKGQYAKKFLTHMMSKDFFKVDEWPTAKLVVESVKGNKAKGKLTIKDKTNPVEFAFTEKKGTYKGTLKFDRTKFGMVYGSGDFFKGLGDKMIYNDVTLDFEVKVKDLNKKMAAN